MFLVDKYRPKSIDDIFFHIDLYSLLQTMSSDKAIPHIIFYGGSGSGKNTLVDIFLKMLYDESVTELTKVKYDVVGSNNKISEEEIPESNYHIVIEPHANNYDRYLIHDVIKLYASRPMLDVFKTGRKFKTILIKNADTLSPSAQFALRRTMEDNSGNCRFILMTNSLSKIIKPIISRCECLKIPNPTNAEMMGYIIEIADKEYFNIGVSQLANIVFGSRGDIKKALWKLQTIIEYKSCANLLIREIDKMNQVIKEISRNKINSNVELRVPKEELKKIIKKSNFKYMTYHTNKIINSLMDVICNILKYSIQNKTKAQLLNICKNKEIKKYIKKNTLIEKYTKMLDLVDRTQNFLTNINLLSSDDEKIVEIIKILKTKNIANMTEIRNCIFNMMITNISSTEIITKFIDTLLNDPFISDDKKVKLVELFANGEHNLANSRRAIIHFDNVMLKTQEIL
uniref:AAA+ ATPase domain-containing protein n=1 Tax=viral metagenome TaxID=1070528 RepID=A0A6C0EBL3_9ZZZZ